MEIKKQVLWMAFFLTLILFFLIVFLGSFLDQMRKSTLTDQIISVNNDVYDLQKIMLMSEVYGPSMACIAFKEKLFDYDQNLWGLGQKLDQYQTASEEIVKSKYYRDQKIQFNEKQFIYMMLLDRMQYLCNISQPVVIFFYSNQSSCPKCDDQSFILADIKRDVQNNVAIFAYDVNLNITSVDLLTKYYNLSTYPCTIVNSQTKCGITDRVSIMQTLCNTTNGSVC